MTLLASLLIVLALSYAAWRDAALRPELISDWDALAELMGL